MTNQLLYHRGIRCDARRDIVPVLVNLACIPVATVLGLRRFGIDFFIRIMSLLYSNYNLHMSGWMKICRMSGGKQHLC